MKKFKCYNCELIFESEGLKHEYNNAIYGPCVRFIAKCPNCNNESNEFSEPKKNSNLRTQSNPCNGCCGCH